MLRAIVEVAGANAPIDIARAANNDFSVCMIDDLLIDDLLDVNQ
jgi:hypothetical protein